MPRKPTANRRRATVLRPTEKIVIENAPTIYVNSVQVEVTPWDFKLRLAQIGEASTDRLLLNELCFVYLSPQHAKALAMLLSQQVASYEKQVGPIPLGPK
jgi:hypothetical protein